MFIIIYKSNHDHSSEVLYLWERFSKQIPILCTRGTKDENAEWGGP